MKDPQSQEKIDEMRKRLYDRGSKTNQTDRHHLTDVKYDVSRDWGLPEAEAKHTTDLREAIPASKQAEIGGEILTDKPKRHYRSFVLIGSLLIFIFVAGVSSLFLYFGGNQVSNDNIRLEITGENSVGGGETTEFDIGIANQNSVPIESATLIIKYPPGTRSVGDTPRNLYEERIPVEDILPGEFRNIPVRVAMFGEENQEKQVSATIEYRIGGSNSLFFKEADPHAVLISSSPLVLRVQNLEKVASGQRVTVTVTAQSNASRPLTNILLRASYPGGFDFASSDPEPVFGENVWRIDELLPEQSTTFKIEGITTGLTEENFRVNFEAGPASDDNQYEIGAGLADARADFTIERPFIDVQLGVNGDEDLDVIIEEEEDARVGIQITNTLDETVYDMVVEVIPVGNALDEQSIVSSQGFYDSNTGSVRWEVANNPSFEQILPGATRELNFEIKQGQNRTTSSFDLIVNVYARRVDESSALEQLIGTVTANGKYSSQVNLASQAGRNIGRFGDSGPIPPVVGESTTYTLVVVAEAGVNDLVNTLIDIQLPVYVKWLDSYDAKGTVTHNDVANRLQWDVGDIDSGSREEFIFQVGFTPSISQLRTTPRLLLRQSIRANDRFTGALLQDTAEIVTTELSTEYGFEEFNGRVVR